MISRDVPASPAALSSVRPLSVPQSCSWSISNISRKASRKASRIRAKHSKQVLDIRTHFISFQLILLVDVFKVCYHFHDFIETHGHFLLLTLEFSDELTYVIN